MNKEEIEILEMYQDVSFFERAFKGVSKEEFKVKLYKSYMKQLDLKKELDLANKKIEEIKEYITLHTITEEDLSGWHTVLRDIEGILSIIGSD